MKNNLSQKKASAPCFSLRGVFVFLCYVILVYGMAAIMDREGVTSNLQYVVQKKVNAVKAAVSQFTGWETDASRSAYGMLLAGDKGKSATYGMPAGGGRAKQPAAALHGQSSVYNGSHSYYLPHYKDNVDL